MPRKKFLPTYEGCSWGLGIDSLAMRPELAGLIGRAVAAWPYIENDLGLLLGGILQARNPRVLSAFFAIRASRSQREIIIAAADSEWSEDDLKLLNVSLKKIGDAESERNDLAHGVWGVIEDRNDELIWIHGKHLGPWNAIHVTNENKIEHRPKHIDMLANAYVYGKDDIENSIDKIVKARTISFKIAELALWKPGRPSSQAEIRDQLRALLQ